MSSFIAGLIFGVLIGASLLMLYSIYTLKKAKSKLLDKIKVKADEMRESALNDAETRTSIVERLREAARIAEEQLALRAQAEMPSKNSLHSRYKNGLVGQLQDLEQQKISILKTVLGDGVDPLITVSKDGGGREEIKLSQYVAEAEEVLGSMGYVAPQEQSQGGPKKAGKFIIYKGGKDDGSTSH